MVTALSVPMLGEHVGWRGGLAVYCWLHRRAYHPAARWWRIVFRFHRGSVCRVLLRLYGDYGTHACRQPRAVMRLSVYVIAGPMLSYRSCHARSRDRGRLPTSNGWLLFTLCRRVFGRRMDWHHRRLSARIACNAGAVRIHGTHRRCNRRLPDLG